MGRIERLQMKTAPPEFVGAQVIGSEGIDRNAHLNHAYYFVLFEQERAEWIKNCGITIEEIRERYGVSPLVVTALIDYKGQVYEGDQVTIYTAAENARSHLVFSQRMLRGVDEVSRLNCVIGMVDDKGNPRRVPEGLGLQIKSGNEKFLGG